MSYEEERLNLTDAIEKALEVNDHQTANGLMDKVEALDSAHEEEQALTIEEPMTAEEETIETMENVVEIVEAPVEMENRANIECFENLEAVNMANLSETKILTTKETMNMSELTFGKETIEYKNAWLNNLVNRASVEEMQMITTSGGAVPTLLIEKIAEVAKKNPGFVADMDILNIPGMTKYIYESSVADAAAHTEGNSISDAGDALTGVALTQTELVKLLPISASMKEMAIEALESYVVKNLYEAVLRKIDALVIGAMETQAGTDSQSETYSGSMTLAKVNALIALLPEYFDDADAKFYCTKSTLFNQLMPIEFGKENLVKMVGSKFFIFGHEVVCDANVTAGSVLYANPKKSAVVNVAGGIQVSADLSSGFRYGTVDYRAIAPTGYAAIVNGAALLSL